MQRTYIYTVNGFNEMQMVVTAWFARFNPNTAEKVSNYMQGYF